MSLIFRKAQREDLEEIIRMLSDDVLGISREDYLIPLPSHYVQAFEKINNSADNLLIVADHPDKKVIGTMQLTFIPGLSRKGSTRLLIESVRIDNNFAGNGIGSQMIKWAIEEAKKKNCKIVQLTSDKTRIRAHNFYKKLGFKDSHIGMKLEINNE